MNAILIESDKSLVWSEVPDPIRRNNEIIMEVHAAALNRADLLQREGNYPSPKDWPEWMGLEVSGIVLEAPESGRWKKGDKVCALLGGGGYAEKVAVPVNLVLPVPEGLSMVEAAAIPEVFMTAYLNLFIEGDLKSGETVFVQAGASGLGTAVIQLAKLIGAKVITTVGSDKKADFVQGLGADVVINRKKEDVASILNQYRVNLAIDCVAGPALGDYLKSMERGGRWIVLATLGGDISKIDMTDFFKRGVRLIGSTLRSRSLSMKANILSRLENELWPKFSSRDLRVIIHEVHPIQNAEEAQNNLKQNKNIGKVVLVNNGYII
ncbi:NAD(P)H-quinone oxidoreductase [Arenibacter algicola]|uniref:NAD(P)H-quinone oxidoreductase n=1 Tax=Arenibacter algicola TaxID=616991 RepID=UPI001C06BA55|nr:NAD(P)H-quinone oxidoreductase [Arenibacter algicola]MBU2904095.1 NAD(P)H-quinone oxidoreductase [Arenibacter algicola]